MSDTVLAALAVATVGVAFPANTADTPWTFALTGTNPDGTPYAESVDSNTSTLDHDLPAGATGVVLVVTKNGISSLASDPFDVPADTTGTVTITLAVPDATQKATIALAPAADGTGTASTSTSTSTTTDPAPAAAAAPVATTDTPAAPAASA